MNIVEFRGPKSPVDLEEGLREYQTPRECLQGIPGTTEKGAGSLQRPLLRPPLRGHPPGPPALIGGASPGKALQRGNSGRARSPWGPSWRSQGGRAAPARARSGTLSLSPAVSPAPAPSSWRRRRRCGPGPTDASPRQPPRAQCACAQPFAPLRPRLRSERRAARGHPGNGEGSEGPNRPPHPCEGSSAPQRGEKHVKSVNSILLGIFPPLQPLIVRSGPTESLLYPPQSSLTSPS